MIVQVTDIQRFCMHDGPGVRTTVFLKGCPLRCQWCHNPETQMIQSQLMFTEKLCVGCHACEKVCPEKVHSFDENGKHLVDFSKCIACGFCTKACLFNALEISGKAMDTNEIIETAEKDKPFYRKKGGLTISGGEPTVQFEGLVDILNKAKEKGLNTNLETCGFFPSDRVDTLVPLVDSFDFDIKLTNEEDHIKYTGVSNKTILENLSKIDALMNDQQMIRLRCILVNGVNTTEEHYQSLANIYHSLHHCEGVEFMPYHVYGASKNERIGKGNNAHNEWIPSSETIHLAEKRMKELGVSIKNAHESQ